MIISRNRFRVTSNLLVAVLIANWLLIPFLFSRNEHIWCQEHQEVEHLHGHEHSEHDLSSDIDMLFLSRVVSASIDSPNAFSSRPHEACHVLAQLNQQSNSSPCADICGDMNEPGKIRIVPVHNIFQSISRLTLAPKTSPPIV